MGYSEDAPVSLGRNVRHNENCVWVADAPLNDAIFERVRALLGVPVLRPRRPALDVLRRCSADADAVSAPMPVLQARLYECAAVR